MATIDKDELAPAKTWEELGGGGFGAVFRVLWKTQKKHVAVKKLFKADFREIEILKELNHPNIVTLFGFAQEAQDLMIVMELCELGSLRSFLERQDNPLEPPLIFDWMIQASLPIDYLRNHRIEHMDIKTDNYVITSSMVLKLTDFGLSQVLEKTKTCSNQAGSWRWMPPERFSDNKLSPAFHIYSLALIYWCLFTRSMPYAKYRTEYSIANAVAERKIRPTIPSCCPKPIGELIERCWHHDRSKRPEINVVITTLFLHKSAFAATSQEVSTQTRQRGAKTTTTQTHVNYADVSTQTDIRKHAVVTTQYGTVLPITESSPASTTSTTAPANGSQKESSAMYGSSNKAYNNGGLRRSSSCRVGRRINRRWSDFISGGIGTGYEKSMTTQPKMTQLKWSQSGGAAVSGASSNQSATYSHATSTGDKKVKSNESPQTSGNTLLAITTTTSNKCRLCRLKKATIYDLESCGHKACTECIEKKITPKSACQECGALYGWVTDQSCGGRMIYYRSNRWKIDGKGVLELDFKFNIPTGVQHKFQPNPGQTYVEMSTRAFLPDTREGLEVLDLMQWAFQNGRMFYVSKSPGGEDVLLGEIPLKRYTYGGRRGNGYPDDEYLPTVKTIVKRMQSGAQGGHR